MKITIRFKKYDTLQPIVYEQATLVLGSLYAVVKKEEENFYYPHDNIVSIHTEADANIFTEQFDKQFT